jgi:hypothetical protein
MRRTTLALACLLSTGAGIACGRGDSPAAPAAVLATGIAAVAGDQQSAPAESELAVPLTVLVTDAEGRPVPSLPVTWRVKNGGGALAAESRVTDAAGRAAARWTLGAPLGAQRVTATIAGRYAATFTGTAVSDTTKPVLTGFALAPAEVHVQRSDSLTLLVSAADASTGLTPPVITFSGPGGVQFSSCWAFGRWWRAR